MNLADLIAIEKQHVWHPFTPMQAWCAEDHEPLLLVSGEGCVLRDQHGREYLDGNASIWTNIHGHQHPVINAAIREQLERVAHTSFLGFTHEPAIRLAKELTDLVAGSGLTRVFYSDNGSTAIEAGVRMALQYWQQNGAPQRRTIITFDRAYHGDTLGAASLGGLPVFKGVGNDFGYQVQRVGGMDGLAQVDAANVAAVLIEPLIQGAAGMRVWPKGMLSSLRTWCDTHDVLMITDEVMTGFGRSGEMFACEHEGVWPDIMAVAKGITGGYLPLAVTFATERLYEGFLAPGHTFFYGHSYTANQLGCAAALASLRVFREERVLERLPQLVADFDETLNELRSHPAVREVRQCGLMAGIELRGERIIGAEVCLRARRHGLLTRPILNTLVLMPPLCVSRDQLQQMANALRLGIDDVLSSS